jgi:pyruvate/2-oxoglutarate dehydrogenase complex dihydrolipoamide acyltransferase (E2) component
MVNVCVPELGDAVTKATVACWHYKTGDYVEKDTDLVELVTDKAVFFVPVPVSGKVHEILAVEGQDVVIGGVLARIQ